MRLAVSSIAWERADDDDVATALVAAGVDAIEVAPTKAWPDPRLVGREQAGAERMYWAARGLEVIATQSLLFGRPDLVLFGDSSTRRRLVEHLSHMVALGGHLGARAQVFGSPRNRRRGAVPREEATEIASEAFSAVAVVAEEHGTCLCLEANPIEYGADFLTSAHEAAALVAAVDRPGLRLHLDTACMVLAGDDVQDCVHRYHHLLQHVHLSEPGLGPVGSQTSPAHVGVLAALREIDYHGCVSIEMRPTPTAVESVALAAVYGRRLLEQW